MSSACKVTPHPLDLRVDPRRRKLVREGTEGVLGPAEAAALELGLELKGRYGGQVTVLSLGPPAELEGKKSFDFLRPRM